LRVVARIIQQPIGNGMGDDGQGAEIFSVE